MKMQLRDYVSV